MDDELKQRIIGAVVVTALAAIFLPMLFDDPVDNNGKAVSELTIPKAPGSAENIGTLPENKADVLNQSEPSLSVSEIEEPEPITPDQLNNTGNPNQAGTALEGLTPSEQSEGITGEIKDTESVDGDDVNQDTRNQQKSSLHQALEQPAIKENAIDTIPTPVIEKKTEVKTAVKAPEKVKKIKTETKVKTKTANKTLPTKDIPASSKLKRWSIQAGSFSKKENAQAVVDKLRKQGLPASIVTKGNLFRVKVGPELDKKKAVEMKSKLDKLNVQSYLQTE